MTAIFRSGGADPGVHGAISRIAYDPATRRGLLRIHDIPTVMVGKTNPKPQPDPIGIARLLKSLSLDELTLERVTGFNGEGASRAFNFGHGRGAIAGVAAAFEIPLDEPVPSVWKPKMAVPSDKQLSIARANQLLPGCKAAWPNKGHHDRAESALLALHGLFRRGWVPLSIELET